MWKQKLKICGINLAAYIVVLIIMAMLSVCSRLYGQEKPMLSPEHTKRIAPGIDTTKLPSFEYGKSFLSPHFGIIHKKPEMLLNFRPDYTLAYYTQENPFQSGLPTVAYCADQLCMSAGYSGEKTHRRYRHQLHPSVYPAKSEKPPLRWQNHHRSCLRPWLCLSATPQPPIQEKGGPFTLRVCEWHSIEMQ